MPLLIESPGQLPIVYASGLHQNAQGRLPCLLAFHPLLEELPEPGRGIGKLPEAFTFTCCCMSMVDNTAPRVSLETSIPALWLSKSRWFFMAHVFDGW